MFENWDTLTPIANWPVLSRFKPCLPLPILLLLADSSFSVTIDIYYSTWEQIGRKRCFYASKSWPATSTNQLISSTLKTPNYYPIKNHQPLSNTTQQHVQTADLEHGKPKSHLLLLTPELHPVTDAAVHVVSGAGEICWSRCKCRVGTQGVFFFIIFYFPKLWISKYWWIWIIFLDINHLIWVFQSLNVLLCCVNDGF